MRTAETLEERDDQREDAISLFKKYLKKEIVKDLKLIYKEEGRIIKHDTEEDAWIFRLENANDC